MTLTDRLTCLSLSSNVLAIVDLPAPDGERAWTTDRLRYRGLTAPVVVGRSIAIGDFTGYVHLLSLHTRTGWLGAWRRNTFSASALAVQPDLRASTNTRITSRRCRATASNTPGG